MAIEKSPYEGAFDQLNGKTAIGQVVSVDITNRRCRVKTVGQQGPRHPSAKQIGNGTEDHDISDVQWITTAGSDPESEDTSVPSVGDVGILIHINHEAYLIGFFRTLQPSPQDDTEPDTNPMDAIITQGDRILKNVGGNYIILRRGGSIEIASTAICRTYWLPSLNLISSVCGDYELTTDGGYEDWSRDQTTGDTLRERLAWDNLEPTNAVYTQEGTADTGAIFRRTAGPLDENSEVSVPTYDLQIDPLGKESKTVAQAIYSQVGPDPTYNGYYSTTQDVNNLQGTFSTPSGHIVVFDDSSSDGSISVIHRTGASIQITGTGTMNIQAKDGSITTIGGGVITSTSAKAGTVSISDSVTISDSSGSQIIQATGSGITITATNPVTVQAPNVTLNTSSVAIGNSSAELLSLLYQIITAIGQIQVLTPVGLAGPILTSAGWAQVLPLLIQLQLLTGSV